MRILVTGGAGYIGSHTCKALAEAGHVPIVYDNLVNGHRWAVQWGPLIIGDLLDQERLRTVLDEHRPEIVMHFAAYAYVGESVKKPARYYWNNVAGAVSLLRAMLAGNIDKIVFSSTCATYGLPQQIPITETHSQQPINPYGAGKLMIERMLSDFQAAYGMQSVSLRYFNAAGADSAARIGELHKPETHLIPLLLRVAAGRQAHVDIYGADYDTPDGTCIRDYVHVTDLARAHVQAMQYLMQNKRSAVFNLGNGNGFSVREVIDTVAAVTGVSIPARQAPKRSGDPPVLVGSAERARQQLGWIPQYADLAEIVNTAWRWYQRADSLHYM